MIEVKQSPLLDGIKKRALKQSGVDCESVGVCVMPIDFKIHESNKSSAPVEIEAIANTASVDMDDEVVVPSGGDPSIQLKYGAIYYNHNYGTGDDPVLPVGAIRYAKLIDQGSAWKIRFSISSNPFAQDVLTGIREGIIRGTSIGFARDDFGPPTPDEVSEYGEHSFITRRWRWLETSVTPMPCNPDAMIQGMTMSEDAQRSLAKLVERGRIGAKSAALMSGSNRINSGNKPLTRKNRRVIIIA